MPFRVSGKNIDIGEALRERIERAGRRSAREIFRRRIFGPRDGRQGGLRISHRMRGASRFRHHAAADAMAGDAYVSADQAAESIEKRLRRYHRRLKDHHAHGRNNGACDAADQSMRRATSLPRRHDDSEEDVTAFNPVIIAESTTALQAAVGQRSRHGTRYDRRSGHGVPPRRPRPGQPGLPPCRRPYRLDRSARHRRVKRPLTGADGRPYGPPPFRPKPLSISTVPDRFQCRSPISLRRTRSSRRSRSTARSRRCRSSPRKAAELTGQNERAIFEIAAAAREARLDRRRQRHRHSARQAAEARAAVRAVRAARAADRFRSARRPAGRSDFSAARAGRRRRRSSQGAGAGGAAAARSRRSRASCANRTMPKRSTPCWRCRRRPRRSLKSRVQTNLHRPTILMPMRAPLGARRQRRQCTLTVSSSWLNALAMAASRRVGHA